MRRAPSFDQAPPAVRVQLKSPTESAGGLTRQAGNMVMGKEGGLMVIPYLLAKLTPRNENKGHGFNTSNSQLNLP